jgi:hypothetical protein
MRQEKKETTQIITNPIFNYHIVPRSDLTGNNQLTQKEKTFDTLRNIKNYIRLRIPFIQNLRNFR